MIAESEAPAVLTTAEVAERYAVTTHTVCNWIRRGVTVRGRLVKLAAFPAGKNYRIAPEALQTFLAALAGQGAVETPDRAKQRERGREQARRGLDARLGSE